MSVSLALLSKSTSAIDILVAVEEEAIPEAGVRTPNQISFLPNYTS
jgi:hypothetical protein